MKTILVQSAHRVGTVALALVLLALVSSPVRALEIMDAQPRIITVETRVVAPSGPPVDALYTHPDTPPLAAYREPRITLRFEVLDTAAVSTPFRIRIQAYGENGFPEARFHEPVTYECLLGIIPVVSSATWLNGLLEDTLIVLRPGHNARISAVAGGATASTYLDIAPPPLTRALWLRQAEEYLGANRFDDAIHSFEKAASLSPGGDAEIETRIGKLYLQRGQWREAQVHFLNAVRSSVDEP